MRQIILDTETTGLETELGHRIIEIGCVELINRKLTGNHYHQYLNPERDIDEGAKTVHGLTSTFLQDKPCFRDVVHDFVAFVNGAELIIHNAPFDVGFLDYELKLLKQSFKPITSYCRIVDTLVLARQLHVGQRNSLDALCKRYNIDNSQRDLHGALLDANLLARVYLAMTGGQATLFADHEPAEVTPQVKQDAMMSLAKKQHSLTVIKAGADELTEHQTMLELLQKKGKCLWNELI